jgi:catechol 2,3-dioxygenase-like lactoylglutathione lyase family enzyme
MNLHRIDHVSLDVADRARSLDWYAAVLGATAGSGHAATAPEEPVFLGPLGARLGLFQERAPGLRHIALATDDAGQQRVVARLDRLAIPYVAERHRDHDSVYFADPDGTMLEVMVAR